LTGERRSIVNKIDGILATLGVKVTLIEGRTEVLGFLDDEITEAFQYQMRRMGMTLRLGEKVATIEQVKPTNGNGNGHGRNLTD